MAKKYVSPDTLKAFMVIVKTALAGKIDVTSVVDNLTSTDTDKPLSAAQGKALKDLIDAAGTADIDAKTLEGFAAADFVKAANIVTDLAAYTPADADGKVAAAALVKTLQATVTSLQDAVGKKLDGTDILTDWATLSADKTQLVAAALVKAIKDQADGIATRVTAIEADYVKAADVTTAVNGAKTELNAEIAKKADTTTVTTLSGTVDTIKTDYAKTSDVAATYATKEELETAGGKYIPLTQKGAASGVAPLDASGLIDSQYLPSYVDDVIEGYMNGGVLYKEAAHTNVITGETGKIYVDIESSTSQCYRWSGSAYIKISDNDMVELTEADVETMWNEVVAANA